MLFDEVGRLSDFGLGRPGQNGLADQTALPVSLHHDLIVLHSEEHGLNDPIPALSAFPVKENHLIPHHQFSTTVGKEDLKQSVQLWGEGVSGKPKLPGEMRRGLWQVETPDNTFFPFPLDKL
jgi:hypothetical protein